MATTTITFERGGDWTVDTAAISDDGGDVMVQEQNQGTYSSKNSVLSDKWKVAEESTNEGEVKLTSEIGV